MMETSQDILNITIAASVFLVAVLLSFGLYYFARILEQFFKIVKEMRERVNKVDEVLKMFKEKIEHSTSYLLLIGEGVKKLVEIARDYTGDKRGKKKK